MHEDSLHDLTARINNRIWISTNSSQETIDSVRKLCKVDIDVLNINGEGVDNTHKETNFSPNTLGHIYQFSQKLLQRPMRDVLVVVPATRQGVTMGALLLGGYLIVCERLDLASVIDVFACFENQFVSFCEVHNNGGEDLNVVDCWAALFRASNKDWLDFSDTPVEGSIDMEEYLHYDQIANGNFHVVVPDKLLAFPCPADHPDHVDWLDQGGVRSFSAAYYAEVFHDFDVAVAVCCAGADEDIPYDPAALAERAIAVDLLAADPRSGALLDAIDRIVTLARAAPGAIALHGTGAWEEGLLLSACLIRLHGFQAREALAWARMAHPSGAVAAPVLALHDPAGTVDDANAGSFGEV